MEKANLKGSILITPKDIQLILDCCINTARKELAKLRKEKGKKRITVVEYCDYWKLNIDDIIERLNSYR